jgi:hypothetical protein
MLAVILTLMSSGRLTLDVGWGRRLRPLGPLFVRIGAPRETVFELIALPYLSANPPAKLRRKIEVLERGTDMVVAAHRTKRRVPAGDAFGSAHRVRPARTADERGRDEAARGAGA